MSENQRAFTDLFIDSRGFKYLRFMLVKKQPVLRLRFSRSAGAPVKELFIRDLGFRATFDLLWADVLDHLGIDTSTYLNSVNLRVLTATVRAHFLNQYLTAMRSVDDPTRPTCTPWA